MGEAFLLGAVRFCGIVFFVVCVVVVAAFLGAVLLGDVFLLLLIASHFADHFEELRFALAAPFLLDFFPLDTLLEQRCDLALA